MSKGEQPTHTTLTSQETEMLSRPLDIHLGEWRDELISVATAEAQRNAEAAGRLSAVIEE